MLQVRVYRRRTGEGYKYEYTGDVHVQLWWYVFARGIPTRTYVVGSVLTRRTTLIGTWAVGLDP